MAKKKLSHLEQMAEWAKETGDSNTARKFFEEFKDPFGDSFFHVEKDKDDFLRESACGDNTCFKEILTEILGEEEMKKEERNIFEPWGLAQNPDHLSTELLDKYQETYKKQYLKEADILTVWEYPDGGDGAKSSDTFFVIDFTHRKIYQLVYEQEDCGDTQNMVWSSDITFGKPKYIGYIITCGGDCGWRFSNHSEWHSGQGKILFPYAEWDKEKIKDFLKKLDKRMSNCHCSTLSELLDKGYEIIEPIFKENGICVLGDYKYEEDGWHREGSYTRLGAKVLKSKQIEIINFEDLKK